MLMPPRIRPRCSSHSACIRLPSFPPGWRQRIPSPPSVSDPLFRLWSIIAIANCAPGCPSTDWLHNEIASSACFLANEPPRIRVTWTIGFMCMRTWCVSTSIIDRQASDASYPATTRYSFCEIFTDNI